MVVLSTRFIDHMNNRTVQAWYSASKDHVKPHAPSPPPSPGKTEMLERVRQAEEALRTLKTQLAAME